MQIHVSRGDGSGSQPLRAPPDHTRQHPGDADQQERHGRKVVIMAREQRQADAGRQSCGAKLQNQPKRTRDFSLKVVIDFVFAQLRHHRAHAARQLQNQPSHAHRERNQDEQREPLPQRQAQKHSQQRLRQLRLDFFHRDLFVEVGNLGSDSEEKSQIGPYTGSFT